MHKKFGQISEMKMQYVKFVSQQEWDQRMENNKYVPSPPTLQQEYAVYRRPPFHYPLNFVWRYKKSVVY